MKTKKYFYLLILALMFSAFASGGCGGSSDGFVYTQPATESLLNGEWRIVSGHVEIYNMEVSGDYIIPSFDELPLYTEFSVTVSENGSNDKYTITLKGGGVYAQDNTTSVFGQFYPKYFSNYDTDQQKIALTFDSLPIVLGTPFYTQLDAENFTSEDLSEGLTDNVNMDIISEYLPEEPIEIYSWEIAPEHLSLFWIESGDIDTLYWESVGNTNYYIKMERQD
ncbi:MAG: hypothetical protein IJP48_01785 [Synergistaceae bacterium]|nr:hypothetical protein [Synergistaceae bacterium]